MTIELLFFLNNELDMNQMNADFFLKKNVYLNITQLSSLAV